MCLQVLQVTGLISSLFWSYVTTTRLGQLSTVSGPLLKPLQGHHRQSISVSFRDVLNTAIPSAPHLHVSPRHPSELLEDNCLSMGRQQDSSRTEGTPQNHRMVRVGRDLCGSSSPTPCRSRVTYSRLHRTASRQVLNISREVDPTTLSLLQSTQVKKSHCVQSRPRLTNLREGQH